MGGAAEPHCEGPGQGQMWKRGPCLQTPTTFSGYFFPTFQTIALVSTWCGCLDIMALLEITNITKKVMFEVKPQEVLPGYQGHIGQNFSHGGKKNCQIRKVNHCDHFALIIHNTLHRGLVIYLLFLYCPLGEHCLGCVSFMSLKKKKTYFYMCVPPPHFYYVIFHLTQ